MIFPVTQSRCLILATFLLVTTGVLAGADSPVFVLTSENRVDAETFLVQVQDGREQARIKLGTTGEYGQSDRQLAILLQKQDQWLLRRWDLRSGKELASLELPELPVTPIQNFSGFNPGLFIDPQDSLIIWIGVRDVEVARQPGRVVIKEAKQRYYWGGVDLSSGETFEVESPSGVLPGASPSPAGQGRLGTFVEGEKFLVYDPAKRRLDPESDIAEMKVGRWFAEGVGIVSLNKERQYVRHTTADLTPLEAEETILGSAAIAGQVRFRREPGGTAVALVAIGGRDRPTTSLSVRDPLTGAMSLQKELPARLYNFIASQDGRVCLFVNKPEKKAVRFDRRDGSIRQIDYSRYEKPELIVGLATED